MHQRVRIKRWKYPRIKPVWTVGTPLGRPCTSFWILLKWHRAPPFSNAHQTMWDRERLEREGGTAGRQHVQRLQENGFGESNRKKTAAGWGWSCCSYRRWPLEGTAVPLTCRLSPCIGNGPRVLEAHTPGKVRDLHSNFFVFFFFS